MALAQVETTAGAADVELRLYHLGEKKAINYMGRLALCGPFPPATLQGDATVDGGAEDSPVGSGFYLAVLEEGEIVDVARLSSLVGHPLANTHEEAEVAGGKAAEKETSVGKGEEEEEEEEGNDRSGEEVEREKEEKGEENSEEKEEEGEESSEEEDWEESSEEEDGEYSSGDEEDGEEGEKKSFLQVRIWPGSSFAVLILFHGGRWNLTKAYSVYWLQENEMGELLGIINKESDENDAIACNTMTIRSATSPSHWSKGCISRLDFGGPLLYFNGLEETINVELNPTMDLFKVSKQIGKGAAGKVYQCAYEDAQIKVQYAVKITKVRKHDDIDAYNNNEPREVHIISCLKEPKIVTFYQAWIANECYESNLNEEEASDTYSDTPSDESEFNLHGPKYVLIHMEFCCRTVKEILVVGEREINLEQSWTLFENIAQAVRCVHQKGAIHRDLKPGNIFVGAAGEIKIGDFGHACWARNYIDGQEGTPDRGSDLYAAPELDHGQVTDRVDIYSLGVIFLEIFYPFKSDHERYCLLKDLKSSKYPTDFVGDTLLLKKLTAICPSDRPLANDILEYIGKRQ